ncbi:hypothetical protein IW140_006258 [Coemansia sp. RSA 1813]|nr:hypothetical protein EV178_006267 [Coemansia sp. RSA 1646]KAJ1766059.1 hypothetical protein LPJ74_006072 [Coemansia sp. RSA 1843]KAJ2085545.1 hypothetical protein IW138_006260 [Coemansia sp. RSA 986]KAJ2210408.1 hypothetical protein EV179_006261 [Coemansia sp. RSA 487]KAJ2563010.1 hypothetical protein IW140_006258 [Coemansia sp. RSA 1813]
MASGSKTILRILHFNDVYHVAPGDSDPVGGAARFKSLLHKLQRQETAQPTLTLFSGDAYFPSLESSISRGEHMLPILNSLNIDASTFGNHEFDQGIDQLEHLIERNNFPWIVTNLTDKETGGPAARRNSVPYLIKQLGPLRVGIIGIVEKEWLDTLPCLPPTFVYHDFVKSAREMATKLKKDESLACDLVICLSHMRLPNDIKLADACSDVVDLFLSGHDHFYYVGSGVSEFSDPSLPMLPEKYSGHDDDTSMLDTWKKERAQLPDDASGRRLVKSGTDFRDLSEISLEIGGVHGSGSTVSKLSVTRHRVTTNIPEDAEIKQMVDTIEAHLSKAMDKLIGFTTTAWDARSTVCRTQESNIGSFSGDLMRLCYAGTVGVEIGLLCGGAIRSDKVYPQGQVRMRDIMEIFPFEDPVIVVKLTGSQIRRALENGVSKWPAQEGRFPQVSGIRFEFDSRREPGDRVTSIVLTASAKAAAKHAKDKSPSISREPSTQPKPSRPRGKSISRMHRVAVENSLGTNGDSPALKPIQKSTRNGGSDSAWDSESDIDAESDYGGEEDELLDMDAEYLVATRDYMYQGHDGYEVLTEGDLVVGEENGITFADLYRRFFHGLAVCNALSFKKHGFAQNCSSIRHQLLEADPGDLETTASIVTGLNASGPVDEAKQSRWKQLIVKHADDLRQLAQQRRQEGAAAAAAAKDDAQMINRNNDESFQTLACRIASVVEQYHDSLATKAQLLTHRSANVLRALISSAKRLKEDQEPLRVARTALFGHDDNSSIPMADEEHEVKPKHQSAPRNDDANGLMPGMPINRKDTRSYASEGVIAQWAVVSPQTDGRIKNVSSAD